LAREERRTIKKEFLGKGEEKSKKMPSAKEVLMRAHTVFCWEKRGIPASYSWGFPFLKSEKKSDSKLTFFMTSGRGGETSGGPKFYYYRRWRKNERQRRG